MKPHPVHLCNVDNGIPARRAHAGDIAFDNHSEALEVVDLRCCMAAAHWGVWYGLWGASTLMFLSFTVLSAIPLSQASHLVCFEPVCISPCLRHTVYEAQLSISLRICHDIVKSGCRVISCVTHLTLQAIQTCCGRIINNDMYRCEG